MKENYRYALVDTILDAVEHIEDIKILEQILETMKKDKSEEVARAINIYNFIREKGE